MLTQEQFWEIIERAHVHSPNDMQEKCRALEALLRELPLPDLQSFETQFVRRFYSAYRYDLWAAALIMQGGCSDDGFMDFRSSLISLGQSVFEKALADPDSLADLEIADDWACFEGCQYVAGRIWEESFGRQFPQHIYEPRPNGPAGERFNEWDLEKKFPKLAAKYNYKDSDFYFERDRRQRESEKQRLGEILCDLLLRTKIIPSSGLIPPYKILREALEVGEATILTGEKITWEPIHLDEGAYWSTVVQLENMSPERLRNFPHLQVEKLKLDVSS